MNVTAYVLNVAASALLGRVRLGSESISEPIQFTNAADAAGTAVRASW